MGGCDRRVRYGLYVHATSILIHHSDNFFYKSSVILDETISVARIQVN